ncbi:hypothetical protein M8J76_011383 [Diaphorina citri]|nr:hypothetical protein M8J76_011383 [Diaphorina citri]
MHRIQRLLYLDYKSIKDIILLESAFAETNKCGLGVQQVYLALSSHNLFIATDDVGRACAGTPSGINKYYTSDSMDPAIESLRLVSMFPLDCVRLTVYKERTRNTLKLHLSSDRARYFELGGCGFHGYRAVHWTLWQERIKSMTSLDSALSCRSETSVGTSVTKSTTPLYIMSTRRAGRTFGASCSQEVLCDSGHVHYLNSVERYYNNSEFYRLVEDAVSVWENASNSRGRKHTPRTRKCLPHAHFSYGWGVHVKRQEKHLLFVRKHKSLLALDRVDEEFQLPLPKQQIAGNISQLNLSHSMGGNAPRPLFWIAQRSHRTSDYIDHRVNDLQAIYHEALRLRAIGRSTNEKPEKKPKHSAPTPGLWKKFKNMTISKTKLTPSPCGDTKTNKPPEEMKLNEVNSPLNNTKHEVSVLKEIHLTSNTLNIQNNYKIAPPTRYKSPHDETPTLFRIKHPDETLDLFRTKHRVNSSDCDIEAVATQLSIITSYLMNNIPVYEIVLLANEKCMYNTPHVQHTLLFSHRLAQLVASEIINTKESVPIRAKMIAKFILIAHACSKLHNYESTWSVLAGLQSPAVYRLQQSWMYVRKFHARKYRLFDRMCSALHDPVEGRYMREMTHAVRTSPRYILPLRYILATLVSRIPHGACAVGHRVEYHPVYNALQCVLPSYEYYRTYRADQNSHSTMPHYDCKTYRDERNSRGEYSYRKPTLYISNYKNISRAIDLLLLNKRVVHMYADMMRDSATLDYLMKKHYKEDCVNFVLSKKLE